MSYSSENILAPGTRAEDVRDFLDLLGYKRSGTFADAESGKVEEYFWSDATDYRSWTEILLSLSRHDDGTIVVWTQTAAGRSYYDLVHQNRTISSLKRRFGGCFQTDAGRGRCMRPSGPPPVPAASGCFLAFARFGSNLIKAHLCHGARGFPSHPHATLKREKLLFNYDPRLIANNTLVPFLVATSEDYFKSTFVALLRYSPRRQAFLKSVRLQGDQLFAIAEGKQTVEELVAESMSFQRLSAICRHFEMLDPKLDLAGTLRKPYRRRSRSLFDSIETLVSARHDLIHRAILDHTMTDSRVYDVIYDLEAAIERVYRQITQHYGWFFDKSWGIGKRPPKRTGPKEAR